MSVKVFVGLSGGVDSAVSAALLKKEGYEVTGCFIKIWQPEFTECTWREDRLDAMRVASALNIPFKEIDLSDEYKKEVVDSMVADYARGITPNPDVLCNRSIKFGHFFKWALSQGAEYVATGHYAQVLREGDRAYLVRGADSTKDQSYFLWQIREEELVRTVFPIGSLTKKEVRKLAAKFGLANADKSDSQGLCFVGDVSMEEFLGRYLSLRPGSVLEGDRAIGSHSGAARYTLGQRHGFTLEDASDKGAHYVIGIDVDANTITVSPDKTRAMRKEANLRNVNWINETPAYPFESDVEARYRGTPVKARFESNGGIRVTLLEPHLISPGQSLVVYQGARCLGGGVIE